MCKCDYGVCDDNCGCRCHIKVTVNVEPQEYQRLKDSEAENKEFMAVVEKYLPRWRDINCPPWRALDDLIGQLKNEK